MELLVGFIFGIVSSALVGGYIYYRQKREAAETERKLVILLEQQMLETGKVASTMNVVQDNQENMLEAFHGLRSELTKVIAEHRASDEIAHPFSEVAGAIANGSVPSLLSSSPSTEHLSPDIILSLHKQVFPEGYTPAGKLREAKVWIGNSGSNPENARYTPPPPDEIPRRLQQLAEDWRQQFASLKSASVEEKIEGVMRFHHAFISIHPFLDGNGTVARLLLSMQWRDLTGEQLTPELKGSEYYDALHEADVGDYSTLRHFIHNQLLG